MFCAKCGTELNEGAEFCSKCGTKIGAATEGQNTINQQNENRPMPTQVVVMPTGTGPLVMGLLGLFGGFIPIVKYITGLLSLLAIFVGASQRKKLNGAGLPAGKATAGIVLGSIAVLITVTTIVFSAMLFGALFGGGGSSKSLFSGSSLKRINFFTNTLPEEIQGTAWSDGLFEVEFGKNKVKLHDNWYSVQKIYVGKYDPSTTLVYFDDYRATLVSSKLAALFRNGTSVTEKVFKPLAVIEAERIEHERIIKEIAGVWEGTFDAGENGIGMKLTVSERNGDFTAIFDFFNLPGRSDDVKNGSCKMSMFYMNGKYLFGFLEWIVNSGYNTMELEGRVEDNVLSGKITQNNKDISFSAVKKN